LATSLKNTASAALSEPDNDDAYRRDFTWSARRPGDKSFEGEAEDISISARRLRASCERITELFEGVVAARAVQAEALRRIRGGLPQQDENPITEPRPKRPRGSGRPRQGAHRQHVTTIPVAHGESHSPAVGSLPTGQAAAVHYAQAGAVGDCASRNDGVSAEIEASGAAALTSLGGDWSGQSGAELVARGLA
jgi:hypothetical protein